MAAASSFIAIAMPMNVDERNQLVGSSDDDSFAALIVKKMHNFGSHYCLCKERVSIATNDMDSTTIAGMAYCKHLSLMRKSHATQLVLQPYFDAN